MTPSALAVIGLTIVVSSFLSGVFGMAGGMVLLKLAADAASHLFEHYQLAAERPSA